MWVDTDQSMTFLQRVERNVLFLRLWTALLESGLGGTVRVNTFSGEAARCVHDPAAVGEGCSWAVIGLRLGLIQGEESNLQLVLRDVAESAAKKKQKQKNARDDHVIITAPDCWRRRQSGAPPDDASRILQDAEASGVYVHVLASTSGGLSDAGGLSAALLPGARCLLIPKGGNVQATLRELPFWPVPQQNSQQDEREQQQQAAQSSGLPVALLPESALEKKSRKRERGEETDPKRQKEERERERMKE